MTRKKTITVATLLLAGVGLAGCSSHYRVTDPTSTSVYYTENVKHSDGAVRFEDAATGREVNIQNAEIEKISKDEFNRETGKK